MIYTRFKRYLIEMRTWTHGAHATSNIEKEKSAFFPIGLRFARLYRPNPIDIGLGASETWDQSIYDE